MRQHPPSASTQVTEVATWLAEVGPDLDDSARVELISALEHLKSAASAAQARVSVDFDASQRDQQAAAGVRTDKVGQGLAAQVALARHESPHRGGRLLGLAKALVGEMPHTLAALEQGQTNEWRATLIARETACLSRADRTTVDAQIWADPARTAALGDAAVAALAKRLAYRLDPQAVVDRVARAEKDRRVTLRPAPDTMTRFTGLLPVAEGVACFAALAQAAESARAAGDGRSRDQVMADTLVERVTGQQHAEDVPITVNLIMPHDSLLDGGPEPGHLMGYGPVPAGLARKLAAHADRDAVARIRRLYTHPGPGGLAALESKGRRFRGALADFIELRDQVCRTPWCGAPIRHIDHPVRHSDGGRTAVESGQGLCEACNYAKEAPGWKARPDPGGPDTPHTVDITTPTGHRYTSQAPDPPGTPPPQPPPAIVIELFRGGPRLKWVG